MLEVGCGTGAFTKEILQTLDSGDEFHIVELNADFCTAIDRSLLIPFRKEHPDIEIVLHHAPIEESGLEGKFDAIICGLPFNNFPVELVQQLFEVMFDFLKTGCELAYFEYLGMRGLKRVFGFPGVRRDAQLRTEDIDIRLSKQEGTQETVWLNIPSCRVVRLRACE